MSQYVIFQGGDTKWYYRTRIEGKGIAGTNLGAPTETLSTGFNTYALCQADWIGKIAIECNYSEVAF